MVKVTGKRPETLIEREIATGCIVDGSFLRQIQQLLSPALFETELLKWVWKWCSEYYTRYEDAPGRDIETIFADHRDNPEEPELIEQFLQSISDEYEREGFNRNYVMDRAEDFARRQKLKTMQTELQQAIARGDNDAAEAAIANYSRPSLPKAEAIDPFTDEEAIRSAFEEEDTESLITFPGALGEFINPKLRRDCLVSLLGPNKRGKSYWLQEFALRACRAGRRVLYIDAGDMGRRRVIRRKHSRLAGRSMDKADCGVKSVPVLDCIFNQANTCTEPQRVCDVGMVGEQENTDPHDWPDDYKPCNPKICGGCNVFKGAVSYKTVNIKTPLTWEEGLEKGRRFKKATGFDYKLLCYSAGSVCVADVENRIRVMEEFEGFIPDVIIYDYADILAPEDKQKDQRSQINDTWISLRRQSQDWRALVIAATQADAEAFDATILRPKNFTEDRRKLDHVTSCIGLNQKGDEKRKGIMRLNEMAAREEYFEITDTVSVLQCLDMGMPHLGSFRTHNTEI